MTELVQGGELFDKIADLKKFDENMAAEIIQQVLDAVAYCHSKHIVHRDLKPENLLMEEDDSNSIKVIDFGTSQFFDPDEHMDKTY